MDGTGLPSGLYAVVEPSFIHRGRIRRPAKESRQCPPGRVLPQETDTQPPRLHAGSPRASVPAGADRMRLRTADLPSDGGLTVWAGDLMDDMRDWLAEGAPSSIPNRPYG